MESIDRPQATAARREDRTTGFGRMRVHLSAASHTVRLYRIRRPSFAMFDTDKFIECVREKPALWDKCLKEYSDKINREKSWLEIGEMMYENWRDFEATELFEKVKELKNKWRHIRDNFLKFSKQGKSDGPARKKKKYVYADALEFLKNAREKRRTTRSFEEDHKEEEHDFDDEEEKVLGNACTEPSTSSEKSSSGSRSHRLSQFQRELLQRLDEKSKQEEDGGKLFLLSLLPDYRKLSEDDQFNFKLMTIKFFKDVRQNVRKDPPNS